MKTFIDKRNGEYLVIDERFGWGWCDTPDLYPDTAELETIKTYYPTLDFEHAELIDVNVVRPADAEQENLIKEVFTICKSEVVSPSARIIKVLNEYIIIKK